MLEISRILELAFVAYLEHLYFSISVALISAVDKFIKGSDNFLFSCKLNKRNKNVMVSASLFCRLPKATHLEFLFCQQENKEF